MVIKGKVHCLFEQSGTFKNEFIKLGIPAEDYDIQNNFGETDHVIDLFQQIEDAYDGYPSIFDNITQDDLIVAFYPCIYFCCNSQMLFSLTHKNHKNLTDEQKISYIIERNRKRSEFFERLLKLIGVCFRKGLRLVIENPWAEQTHLKEAFLKKPDVIDTNRMLRGDYFIKPTAYWFFNCVPTSGFTYQNDKDKVRLQDLPKIQYWVIAVRNVP